MALVMAGFAGVFQSLGTIGVIIQKKELSSKLLNSLFTLNVAMGLLIGVGLALSGPFLALLYDTPQVAPVAQVLGLTTLITSFGLLPLSLLSRDMCFDRLVQVELTTTLIQGSATVSLAYLGWKV